MSKLLGCQPVHMILAALSVLPLAARAQTARTSFVIGEHRRVYSQILDEDRVITVYTPEGYDRSDQQYPVVYVLDGDSHFHHLTGAIEFLTRFNRLPPVIVAAVHPENRTRDFLPSSRGGPATTSAGPTHGDDFLRFLTDELAPFMVREYRVAPFKVLLGHSLGGLFAVHAMLTDPKPFDAYVVVSPSVYWRDRILIKDAARLFEQNPRFKSFLYLATSGRENERTATSVAELAQLLADAAPDSLVWEFHTYPEENHLTVPQISLYEGLTALFSDWQTSGVFSIDPREGLGLAEEHFARLSAKYGYEIPVPEWIVRRFANTFRSNDRSDEALEALQLGTRLYPRSARAHAELAQAHYELGNLELARNNYALAVTLAEQAGNRDRDQYFSSLREVTAQIRDR